MKIFSAQELANLIVVDHIKTGEYPIPAFQSHSYVLNTVFAVQSANSNPSGVVHMCHVYGAHLKDPQQAYHDLKGAGFSEAQTDLFLKLYRDVFDEYAREIGFTQDELPRPDGAVQAFLLAARNGVQRLADRIIYGVRQQYTPVKDPVFVQAVADALAREFMALPDEGSYPLWHYLTPERDHETVRAVYSSAVSVSP